MSDNSKVLCVDRPATSSDTPLSGRIENALRYGMATESIARELLKDCQSRIRELEPTATSSDKDTIEQLTKERDSLVEWGKRVILNYEVNEFEDSFADISTTHKGEQ